jgi:hypothetical protein
LCIETFVCEADPVQPPPAAERREERRRIVAEHAEPDEPAVALLDEESPTAEPFRAAPAGPAKPFKAVPFGVVFHSDPDRLFRGRAEAEVSTEGLRVRLRGRRDLWVAVCGAHPACYLGGNRIAVFLDGREVTLAVVKQRTDLNRLARDVVAFLNGDRAELNGRGYSLPWKLALLPWLAVALPVLAIWLRALGGVHGGGRFLWFLFAGLTLLVAFKFMRRESLSNGRRAAAAVTVLGCGFLVLAGAHAYRLAHPTTVPDADWRPYKPQGQRAHVLMPGEPTISPNQSLAGVNTTLYAVNKHTYTLGKTFSLGVAHVDRGQPPNNAGIILDQRRQALQGELGVYGNDKMERIALKSGDVGWQLVMTVQPYRSSSGQKETQVWQLFVIGDKFYALCVKGEDLDVDDPDVKKFFGSFQVGPAPAAPSPTDLPGVVEHWPFESVVTDQQGRTFFVNVGQTDGVRGRALLLHGWNSYVTFDARGKVNDKLNFGENQPFSFVGWLRLSPDNPSGCVLSMRSERPGGINVGLDCYVDNGLLLASMSTDGVNDVLAFDRQLRGEGRRVSDGAWHHIALTRSADGRVSLYVDGNEVAARLHDQSMTGALTTTLRTLGGRRSVFNQQPDSPLFGALDEVAFFNRCLSADEVQQLARWDVP